MTRQQKRIRALSPVQQRARELRREMTPAETILWEQLRNRELAGFKFRRQHPLDRFIVDFYCAACRLVVEIDGDIHDLQQERDAVRTEALAVQGYRIIRFRNEQVFNYLETVLAAIKTACLTGEGHHLASPNSGGEVGGEG
jgi:very-short-patch-repair endonuclease